ncbi:MAG: hypothetical protein NZ585_10580 [Chloracidobacterium sp.]|nr:hypothetical protein [Chloracidobacterium sp.]
MPPSVSGFAGSTYALRMHRQVIHKDSGQVSEETDYAITSLVRTPQDFYALWRGHWQVENRLHHPRDTVFGEDASRSRKGAAGLMYFRDVLINLLHLHNLSPLRSIRYFSANPNELYQLLCPSC